MIINLLINTIILILGSIFSWLPVVTKFPNIGGFDIDSALSVGIGAFNTVSSVIWPLQDVFYGFLFLMGYYAIKMTITFFLGHRAPGHN